MGSRKMIPHSSMLLPFPLRIWEAWDTAAVHRAMVTDRMSDENSGQMPGNGERPDMPDGDGGQMPENGDRPDGSVGTPPRID